MNVRKTILFFIFLNLANCSGSTNILEVKATDTVMVIHADAISCLAIVNSKILGAPATADITTSYFRVPKIKFTKKNIEKDMVITAINVIYSVPGSGNQSCQYGGDDLAALSSDQNWMGSSGAGLKTNTIPAGTSSLTTDCPLYCGGIESSTAFTSTATMDIYGYETVPGSEVLEPIKSTTTFSIQSPF